jgi:hypothetical protein
MWGNDVNGDCCTAEEAFAKACNTPEIFVPDEEVIAWATRHGVLNGATGIDVLDWMQTDGFQMNASTYDDGPSTSVDWTNPTVLQSAISQGPVKTIISADQVENAYQLHQASGWIGTGFTQDENYDHCVSLCGYGQLGWLLGELGTEIPNNLDPQSPFYAMFHRRHRFAIPRGDLRGGVDPQSDDGSLWDSWSNWSNFVMSLR